MRDESRHIAERNIQSARNDLEDLPKLANPFDPRTFLIWILLQLVLFLSKLVLFSRDRADRLKLKGAELRAKGLAIERQITITLYTDPTSDGFLFLSAEEIVPYSARALLEADARGKVTRLGKGAWPIS